MITGGFGYAGDHLSSTEIIDIDKVTISMASPMNSGRFNHGIGFVTINDQERLVVFGGEEYSDKPNYNIDIYNTRTGKWETSFSKLNKPRTEFDFLTVKFGQIQQ